MDNFTTFKRYVDDLLKEDSKYDNEINCFVDYLIKYKLCDKVYDLSISDIDNYFEYALEGKIGSEAALNTHISALKQLFEYLIKENHNYRELLAHISFGTFRKKLSEELDAGTKKQIIDTELLNKFLIKIDKYIDVTLCNGISKLSKTKEKRFFQVMVARIYVKLSLILPLKPSEMLELKLGDIRNDNVRTIKYNGICLKIPSNLRRQIIDTIDYAEEKYKQLYSKDDKLFKYLYDSIDLKPIPARISASLQFAYADIGLPEMLSKKKSGNKQIGEYPPESFKNTAISIMLNSGSNIIYLKRLTGLDINSLLINYDFDQDNKKIDIESANINNSLINCTYYEFI